MKRNKTKCYQLSEFGRLVTWAAWKSVGGCNLPDRTEVYHQMPLNATAEDTTLGMLEDACPYTGRVLARWAVEKLNLPQMAVAYHTPKPKAEPQEPQHIQLQVTRLQAWAAGAKI